MWPRRWRWAPMPCRSGRVRLFALGCNSETYVQNGQHHLAINDYERLGTRPGYCHHCHYRQVPGRHHHAGRGAGAAPRTRRGRKALAQLRQDHEHGVDYRGARLRQVQRAPPRARGSGGASRWRPRRWRECRWRGPTGFPAGRTDCDRARHHRPSGRPNPGGGRGARHSLPANALAEPKVDRESGAATRQPAEGGSRSLERYLGNVIRELRLKDHLTIADVAAQAGISRGHAVQDRDRPGVYRAWTRCRASRRRWACRSRTCSATTTFRRAARSW